MIRRSRAECPTNKIGWKNVIRKPPPEFGELRGRFRAAALVLQTTDLFEPFRGSASRARASERVPLLAVRPLWVRSVATRRPR
jgi:hypothetical protein